MNLSSDIFFSKKIYNPYRLCMWNLVNTERSSNGFQILFFLPNIGLRFEENFDGEILLHSVTDKKCLEVNTREGHSITPRSFPGA